MNDQTYFLANAAHELQTLLSLLCSSIQAIEAVFRLLKLRILKLDAIVTGQSSPLTAA